MANYTIKGLPPIKLTDLLKKRRTNLKDFLKNSGITTFVTLQQKCSKMGVSAPSEEDFKKAIGGKLVTSPQEGMLVLEPPQLVKDSGEKVKVDVFASAVSEGGDPPPIEDSVVKSSKKSKKNVVDSSS